MKMMEPAVSRRITWLRSVFCVMVIYVHCRNTRYFDVAAAPKIAGLEGLLCDNLALIAVPAFFFISAYLFFRGFNWHELLRKWKSRLFTLVIPYVLWNLLYYLAEILLRKIPWTAGAFTGTEIPVSLSAVLQAAFNYQYLPVFWFMQYLIVFTLLAPAVYFLLKNRIAGLVTIALVFSAAMGSARMQIPDWARLPVYLMHYLPAYLTGAYAALHLRDFFEEKRIRTWKILLFGTLSALLIFWLFWKPSFYGIECIRLMIGASLWLSLGAIPFPEPARWMRYTFFLYAAHLMIAKAVNMIVAIKLSNHMVTGGIVWLLLPALIIVICTGVGILFERFLPYPAMILGIGTARGKGSQNAVK